MVWPEHTLRAWPLEIRVLQGDNHKAGDSLANNMNTPAEWGKDGHVSRLIRIMKEYSKNLVPAIVDLTPRFTGSRLALGRIQSFRFQSIRL